MGEPSSASPIEIFFNGKKNNFYKYEHIKSECIFRKKDNRVPFISIMIPTYRRPDTLQQAIASAVNQINVPCDYEIVIVDNESMSAGYSDTETIISGFSADNISYYRNTDNLGMFGNWNRCFELAQGEWVVLLHDDDLLIEDYLCRVTKLLNRKKNIGVIFSAFSTIDMNRNPNTLKQRSRIIPKLLKYFGSERLMRISSKSVEFWNYNFYGVISCGTIFNKKLVLQSVGFDEKLFPSADWFFFYLFNKSNKVYKSLIPLGYYRFSINESLNIETVIKFIEDAAKFRKYLANNSSIAKLSYVHFSREQHRLYLKNHERILMLHNRDCQSLDYIEKSGPKRKRERIYLSSLKCYMKIQKVIALLFG